MPSAPASQHASQSAHLPSGGGSMCLTPLAGFALDGASLAGCMGIRWGCMQRQGPRSTQEDCVVCKVDERGFPHGYFGVFDGHGGSKASEYAAHNLHRNILESAHFPSGQFVRRWRLLEVIVGIIEA